jgi:hypothetical protein
MRHLPLIALVTFAGAGLGLGSAAAAPFDPATVPDQIQAVGHLDVDALRATQIFAAVGGQTAIDEVLDDAPPDIRPLARALASSLRGVSFWKGDEHGAVYLQTGDRRALTKLLAKMPATKADSIDGNAVYRLDHGHHDGLVTAVGDTLVCADSPESLAQSLRVLAGKAPSLAGSRQLPTVSQRGVFVFVTLGDDVLGAIQKSAHAKLMQLSIRSLVVDVGESGGTVTANARAEMRSLDGVDKGKSILEGLRALGSLSGEPRVAALLNGVTVNSRGKTLEVTAKLPVSELVKFIQAHH